MPNKDLNSQDSMARILVVGGSSWFRLAMTTLVADQRWLKLCAEVSTAAEARAAVVHHQPDLILLDTDLVEGNALGLARDLQRLCPRVLILAIGDREDSVWIDRVFQSGVVGYFSKQDETREIGPALWRLFEGESALGRRLTEQAIARVTSGRSRPGTEIDRLSAREYEVFCLLGREAGPTAIAKRLGISVRTVETHFLRLKDKLAVSSLDELKRRARGSVAGRAETRGTVRSKKAGGKRLKTD